MNEEKRHNFFIPGVIDRFEGREAIIITEDNQKLHWPINRLPVDCQEGTHVRLILSTSQSEQEEREKIAKSILNQLLRKE